MPTRFTFANGHVIELTEKGQFAFLNHRSKRSFQSAIVLNSLQANQDPCVDFIDQINRARKLGLKEVIHASGAMDVTSLDLFRSTVNAFVIKHERRTGPHRAAPVNPIQMGQRATPFHYERRLVFKHQYARRAVLYTKLINDVIWDSPIYKLSGLERFTLCVLSVASSASAKGAWSVALSVTHGWPKQTESCRMTDEGLLVLFRNTTNAYVLAPVQRNGADLHEAAFVILDGTKLTAGSLADIRRRHPMLWERADRGRA